MLNSIFQMLAPHHCVNCNARGQLFCEKCVHIKINSANETCYRCNRLSLKYKTCPSCRSSSVIYALYKLSLYEPPISNLIMATKFASAREGSGLLGRIIAAKMPNYDFDLVCYVPTDTKHVRHRGFDHAKLMAREIAFAKSVPLASVLERIGHSRQVGASREQRKKQMLSAFSIKNQELIKNKSILLVDDVVSTAATIESAAKKLKSSGAKRVTVVVAAHNR